MTTTLSAALSSLSFHVQQLRVAQGRAHQGGREVDVLQFWSCAPSPFPPSRTGAVASTSDAILRVASSDAAWASTATCIKKLSIPNIVWVSEKNFGNFLHRFEWFGRVIQCFTRIDLNYQVNFRVSFIE
jgi:hypothetical protein